MNEKHIVSIAGKLAVTTKQVAATALLLNEGATVPFIARYRKERTGELDEVKISGIRDELARLAELDNRRTAIFKSLIERELLTDELKAGVENAETMFELEDLYLPYRPKRRTRATAAREKGLEPLAKSIFEQSGSLDPEKEAGAYISEEKGVKDCEEALAGARDIIAEWINEDAAVRTEMRVLFEKKGVMESKVRKDAEAKGAKFKDYFDWKEPGLDAPSHRVLAMFRAENEEVVFVKIRPPEDEAVNLLRTKFLKRGAKSSAQVDLAIEDSYKRLMASSMEVETRMMLRERADTEAICVFAENLRELLMAPPLGQKAVLAIDPGFRTGCKVVCLDKQGKLLGNVTLHLTGSKREAEEAGEVIKKLCKELKLEAIAIGNGTAGRETETFIKSLKLPSNIQVLSVNESGASIYSASDIAREEFPDHDLTVRGSVSIGRRLMDPLSELVKLDPKSIGVGQYQHDVDQVRLKASLDDVVMSCVNSVGVEVNTASKQLLTYVSGIGPAIAANIIAYRNENGPFKSRSAIKKVPKLGAKAFEQSAGFLRIRNSDNPLDSSAVHPESYAIVDRMAKDLKASVKDLIGNAELRAKLDLEKYVSEEVGMPTLKDIIQELAKPGRDPREKFEAFSFDEKVSSVKDLAPGMKLPGIVTNVTAFGAFVDIGVHQDGLVHISEISNNFVKNPSEVVKVQQKVQVTVMEVDLERNRIALSMKTNPGQRSAPGVKSVARERTGGHQSRPGFNSNPFADAGNLFS